MLSISQTVAWGALYYSFAVLLQPFAAHFAVSEAAVAGAFSLALLCAGAAASFVGTSIDRWGPRPVMTISAVVAVTSLASLASVDTLQGFYVAWAVIGLSHAGVLYEPAFTAIAKWFPSRSERARALLTVTTVAGFASTVFLPLTATMYELFGRQRTLLLLAVLVAVIVVPLNAALPRQRTAAAPTGGHTTAQGLSGRTTPAFVVLAIVFSVQAFASAGATVHLVSYLREDGVDLSTAAAVTGLMGAAQIPARLCFQLFHRAVAPRVRLPLLLGVQAFALVGVLGRTSAVVTPAVLLLGAANGLVTLERATVLADAFGTEHYGAVSGRIATLAHATRAAGPLAVGLMKMASSSYALAFVALALLTALAAVIMWTGGTVTAWRSQMENRPIPG
jgi:MFS family permease